MSKYICGVIFIESEIGAPNRNQIAVFPGIRIALTMKGIPVMH